MQSGMKMGNWGRVMAAAVAVSGAAFGLGMAPEPDPVPRRWELQFDASSLQIANVKVPNVGVRPFVFVTYRVINNSGQDVFFAPAFDLGNGEGDVIRSGRDVPQSVTAELMASVKNPHIQDQVQVIGDILQGEAHAKDGIAIWPLNDLNPTEVVVYATGLSGESKTISSPDGKTKFVVRKTARLEYEAPGMLDGRKTALELKQRGWIMR